jgi:N-acyl-D-amino-acid deacylase
MKHKNLWLACAALATVGAAPAPVFDTLIVNGTIYDGSGGKPYPGSVAIKGDRIVAVGRVKGAANQTIDARGLAVAPGFINMLSWANESLIADGRGMSDTKQGVTLEVMGEGWSMGPLTPAMKANEVKRQGDIKYDIEWTTLGQYMDWLTARGVTPNVASYVGATTIRIHELGEGDVDPTPAQLARMQNLVRAAMNEGALGVGTSLIYAPAFYAETPELVALMQAAAPCGGRYISHMRNESDGVLEAIDELIEISRQSGGPAEIYHLKLAGAANWNKLPAVVARIEKARGEGLKITANMYNYVAGATGLYATMPLWVQAGGHEAWVARLKDPAIRARVLAEMRGTPVGWENLMRQAGGADKVLLLDFKNEKLKPLTGKTLAKVAAMRGTSPEDTAIDLVIEDDSRVGAAFFLMDEANVAKQTAIPWMSFGSDAESSAPEGVFLKSSTHPRAYGNVARLLGKYVREEKRLSLAEAVRKLTSQPAANIGITDRGRLAPGMHADLAIFDPATISDKATFDKPQQYAVGMRHVFVNGVQVLADGEHTGAKPGRVVRGPGYGKCAQQ